MSVRPEIVGLAGLPSQRVFDAVLASWQRGACVALLAPQRISECAQRVERCGGLRDALTIVDPESRLPACSEIDLDALPESASCLFATSGSAGSEPKLAKLSARALLANARRANARTAFGPTDNWLVPLSLHHVGGFGAFLRARIAGGRAVGGRALVESLCADASITHCSLVPTQLYRLLHDAEHESDGAKLARFRSLKAVLLGGGASAASLRTHALQLGVPLVVTYGLTECASQVTTSVAHAHHEAADAGHALDGVRITIADDGEILVGGETVFDGYLADGAICNPSTARGFATGDRGRITDDGRLLVEGRIGLSFKSGGEFVQPESVERALLGLAGVRNAMLVDVADAEWGRIGVAFVDAPRAVSRDELRECLAPHELPKAILPWPSEWREWLKPSRVLGRTLAESLLGR